MKSYISKFILMGIVYSLVLLLANYKVEYLEEGIELKKLKFGEYITYFINDSLGEVEFEKTIVIRSQSEYEELKREFAFNNPKLSNWDSLSPKINFSKNSIIGRSFELNTCEVAINKYYKINDFRKNVHLIYSKDKGTPCNSTTFYMSYFLVPKIPDDYEVFFPIRQFPIPEIEKYVPFTYY